MTQTFSNLAILQGYVRERVNLFFREGDPVVLELTATGSPEGGITLSEQLLPVGEAMLEGVRRQSPDVNGLIESILLDLQYLFDDGVQVLRVMNRKPDSTDDKPLITGLFFGYLPFLVGGLCCGYGAVSPVSATDF